MYSCGSVSCSTVCTTPIISLTAVTSFGDKSCRKQLIRRQWCTQLSYTYTSLSVSSWTHYCKDVTCCLLLSVDSCYSDIVGQELIGQCQSEVRAVAASCIHWVSRCHCWFILNLIVDGSIRVEWGEPVQFNTTPSWCSSHSQHAWWGGGCGNSSA